MPKLKTHKGAAKRFKKTASGGYKHRQSMHRHILTKKSSKRKRQLRDLKMLKKSDAQMLSAMLPHD